MLHVTNGDSAVASLLGAGITGDFLAWKDVLHDGPVPAGLDAAALREVRARFIASRGWTTMEDALRELAGRDERLDRGDEDVLLWFEHDLYDQLQLLQVLDRMGGREGRVWLAQTHRYLGQMSADDARELFAARQLATDEQIACAREAWVALRAPAGPLLEELAVARSLKLESPERHRPLARWQAYRRPARRVMSLPLTPDPDPRSPIP